MIRGRKRFGASVRWFRIGPVSLWRWPAGHAERWLLMTPWQDGSDWLCLQGRRWSLTLWTRL